ncbi:hypothetical protein SCHPADRAFT_802371, partial [Schizopora paradoxa]
VLHPRYKTKYFHTASWPEAWISTSKDILRDEWNDYYKPSDTAAPSAAATQTASSQATEDDDDDLFAPIMSEFTADPIKYWYAKQGDPFARMGLDFMSAPATSVDVERAFSRGSLTVSKHRHALSDQSTRASVVLRSW